MRTHRTLARAHAYGVMTMHNAIDSLQPSLQLVDCVTLPNSSEIMAVTALESIRLEWNVFTAFSNLSEFVACAGSTS